MAAGGKQNISRWDTSMENIVRYAIDALKGDETFNGKITGLSVYNYLKDQNCPEKYITVLQKGSQKIDRKVRQMLKSDKEKEDLAAILQAKLAGEIGAAGEITVGTGSRGGEINKEDIGAAGEINVGTGSSGGEINKEDIGAAGEINVGTGSSGGEITFETGSGAGQMSDLPGEDCFEGLPNWMEIEGAIGANTSGTESGLFEEVLKCLEIEEDNQDSGTNTNSNTYTDGLKAILGNYGSGSDSDKETFNSSNDVEEKLDDGKVRDWRNDLIIFMNENFLSVGLKYGATEEELLELTQILSIQIKDYKKS